MMLFISTLVALHSPYKYFFKPNGDHILIKRSISIAFSTCCMLYFKPQFYDRFAFEFLQGICHCTGIGWRMFPEMFLALNYFSNMDHVLTNFYQKIFDTKIYILANVYKPFQISTVDGIILVACRTQKFFMSSTIYNTSFSNRVFYSLYLYPFTVSFLCEFCVFLPPSLPKASRSD